jgi:hypothetical protein
MDGKVLILTPPYFPSLFCCVPQKRAAPSGEKATAAKKAKPTVAAGAAGGGEGGGIEVDGLGSLSEAEIGAWAQSGQVRSCCNELLCLL